MSLKVSSPLGLCQNVTRSFLSMSCILAKIPYTTYLVKRSFEFRLLGGVVFYLIGFVFVYLGILQKLIVLVYLGSFLLGVGATITFVSVLGFIKFYPTKYFPFFVTGTLIGGTCLTLFYLFCTFHQIQIYNVRWPLTEVHFTADSPVPVFGVLVPDPHFLQQENC